MKTNPLLDIPNRQTPQMPDDDATVIDYRQRNNPSFQRSSRVRTNDLPLFGFNYFEPARRAIQARRSYFEWLVSGKDSSPLSRQTAAGKDEARLQAIYDNPDRPLDQTDFDAVNALTPAQQLDLLVRQRDNKLTVAERLRYRALLNPPLEDPNASVKDPATSPPDESDKLTIEQKVEMLQRQRAGMLTPEEKLKYRKLLNLDLNGAYLKPRPRPAAGGMGDTGSDAARRNANGLGAYRLGPSGYGATRSDAAGLNGLRTDASGLGAFRPDITGLDPSRSFAAGSGVNNQGALSTGRYPQAYQGQFGQPGQSGIRQNRAGGPRFNPYGYDGQDGMDTSLQYPQYPQFQSDPGDRRVTISGASAFNDIVDPIAQLYQNVSASVPVNYQLAGGDKIVLRISSPVMNPFETTLTVDAMGSVMVPNSGRMVVLGQTLAQAETAMAARLVRMYRNAQVSLSLQELRTIPVTVAGESFAPGTYQIPSVATAFNLIYATGGPSEEGSMRNIEVRRRGKLAGNHTIDFYKFLLTGDQAADIQLEAGDVIYIPGRQGVVAVSGEVRRPARFEVTEQESLKDLLRYAGGVKPSGVSQHVQVATVQPGTARLLKDVDINALTAAKPIPVYDGDAVDVFSVRETLTNVVTVEGAVDQPGQYATTPNMTVADLVERARGLLSEAYPTVAQLYRWNPDNTLTLITINLEKALARDPIANVPLTRWDRLSVFTREEIAWTGQREVTVRGAVKKPGIYYRSDSMRVKDLLMLAGGTLPEAYTEQAYLLHQRPDGTYSYDFVSLNAALKDDAKNNVLVQDKDVLAVYRSDEARFTPVHQIDIKGEVITPGQYARGDNMKLSDAIRIAGGLTPRAGERVLVAHARRDEGAPPIIATYTSSSATISPDPALQDGDIITIQGRGAYQEKPYVVNISGAVNRPGPVVLSGPRVRLSEVIKEAGGLKDEAYPEGVEFYRDPLRLTTATQTQIASTVNKLNDILNLAEKEREKARSDIERIKAVGKAGQSSLPLSIPGVSTSVEAPNPALAPGAASVFTHDLVTPARPLTAEDLMPHGNVAVDLAQAIKHPGSDDDLLLLDGDTISIPTRPTTVTVLGAVIHSRGVVYREGAKLDYYLREVGGFTEDAARDRVLVIRVGGGLSPIKEVKQFKPGDIIFVPTKVLAANINKRQTDYDGIFRSLTSSALVFFVAKKLLGF